MSKLPHVGTTIFTVMSKMAQDFHAINLAQGFPNFPVDNKLIQAMQHELEQPIHQYAPMAGNPALLEEIAKLSLQQYNREVNPATEILITAGATQAIFTAIQALVNKEEEVIILDPSYDCYEAPILLTGAQPIRIPLNDAFLPDWSLIRKHVSNNTRLIIINNPHNPSGKVWEAPEFVELEKLLADFPNLIVLSDEVYEYIYFEKTHISVNQMKNIRDRAVIVSSFGKTFHITGWKVGYIVAPEHLLTEIKKVHQFLVFCVNNPAQAALARYLSQTKLAGLGTFYQKKRDLFQELLTSSRFNLLPSEGSYFQLADYSSISTESDTVFCERMVKEFGVAAIPLSVFNADHADRKLIRFCYAKTDDTLKQAAERLCKI